VLARAHGLRLVIGREHLGSCSRQNSADSPGSAHVTPERSRMAPRRPSANWSLADCQVVCWRVWFSALLAWLLGCCGLRARRVWLGER
jgi:hypothetical protein